MAAGNEREPRASRYFVALAVIWVAVMTWRIYPQFADTLRIDGRLMALSDYIEETCAQRIGPAAASCAAEAQETGRRLVAHEQAKSILLVEGPLLGYVLVHVALRLGRGRFAAAGDETRS